MKGAVLSSAGTGAGAFAEEMRFCFSFLLPIGQAASEDFIKTTLSTFEAVTEHPSLLTSHRLIVSLATNEVAAG